MSTAQDIAVSYDVSNEFFGLWLDEGMSYSCALFEGTDNLEVAQLNKLRWISDAAQVTAGQRVLDIGCGWGANLRFLTHVRGAREAVGLTLSDAQHAFVASQRQPGVEVVRADYRDYAPERPFDAATSIGMFEHIATPAEARDGRSIEIYRDFFRRVWTWTAPGAHFGLQSVIGARLPRNPDDLREMAWATQAIFPGAISPRLEDIAQAVNPHWEILEVKTRRLHYARTTAEWLRRLESREAIICARWGRLRFEEYQRYLRACVMSFRKGHQSLAQLALRRIDDAG
jgi:cyclopropane-fatty-acyl-phospholipid synthase